MNNNGDTSKYAKLGYRLAIALMAFVVLAIFAFGFVVGVLVSKL
jgi:hypothetical protein